MAFEAAAPGVAVPAPEIRREGEGGRVREGRRFRHNEKVLRQKELDDGVARKHSKSHIGITDV